MRVGVALICVLVPGAGMAQAVFEPPAGCEVYLTTQARSCQVDHYYRCPHIAADHQWRAAFDDAGLRYVSRIDHQAQWITSGPADDPEQRATLTPLRDPMSLDTLFKEKRDDFEFHERRVGQPFEHITGEDRITGADEIDGEPLLSTTYWLQTRDWQGNVTRTDTGTQYVSQRHRRFFGGLSTITFADGDVIERDDTPVEFIYPGEDGFAATRPLYDCGVMSRAPFAPQTIPAMFHQDLAPGADAARVTGQ